MGTRARTSPIPVEETQDPGHGPGNMVRRQEGFRKTLGFVQYFQTTISVSCFNTASLFLKENVNIYTKVRTKFSFFSRFNKSSNCTLWNFGFLFFFF